MEDKQCEPMMPWFNGFKGTIKKIDDTHYQSKGVYTKMNDVTIKITELPVGPRGMAFEPHPPKTAGYTDLLENWVTSGVL